MSCSGSASASSPTFQTRPRRRNRIESPSAVKSGEAAGSVIRRGSPPPSMIQSACSTPAGSLVGFGNSPARLGPSPRMKAMWSPSRLNARLLMVVPSSPSKEVKRSPPKSGAAAAQTFRAPCSSNTQATRDPSGAAVRAVGNGADITCSRVNGPWAGAGAGASRRATSASGTASGAQEGGGRWGMETSGISGGRGAPAGASPRE